MAAADIENDPPSRAADGNQQSTVTMDEARAGRDGDVGAPEPAVEDGTEGAPENVPAGEGADENAGEEQARFRGVDDIAIATGDEPGQESGRIRRRAMSSTRTHRWMARETSGNPGTALTASSTCWPTRTPV